MKVTKKAVSTLAFGLTFFLAVNVGVAQEQVKEVKPVITVPASLAKAMVTGKVESGKTATAKKSTAAEDMVWFQFNPAITPTNVYNVSNFLTSQGQKSSSGNPFDCATGFYYCAIAVPESQCTPLGGGLYQLNSDTGHEDAFRDL